MGVKGHPTLTRLPQARLSGAGTQPTAPGGEVENSLSPPPPSWVVLGVQRALGLTQQSWNLFGVR